MNRNAKNVSRLTFEGVFLKKYTMTIKVKKRKYTFKKPIIIKKGGNNMRWKLIKLGYSGVLTIILCMAILFSPFPNSHFPKAMAAVDAQISNNGGSLLSTHNAQLFIAVASSSVVNGNVNGYSIRGSDVSPQYASTLALPLSEGEAATISGGGITLYRVSSVIDSQTCSPGGSLISTQDAQLFVAVASSSVVNGNVNGYPIRGSDVSPPVTSTLIFALPAGETATISGGGITLYRMKGKIDAQISSPGGSLISTQDAQLFVAVASSNVVNGNVNGYPVRGTNVSPQNTSTIAFPLAAGEVATISGGGITLNRIRFNSKPDINLSSTSANQSFSRPGKAAV